MGTDKIDVTSVASPTPDTTGAAPTAEASTKKKTETPDNEPVQVKMSPAEPTAPTPQKGKGDEEEEENKKDNKDDKKDDKPAAKSITTKSMSDMAAGMVEMVEESIARQDEGTFLGTLAEKGMNALKGLSSPSNSATPSDVNSNASQKIVASVADAEPADSKTASASKTGPEAEAANVAEDTPTTPGLGA